MTDPRIEAVALLPCPFCGIVPTRGEETDGDLRVLRELVVCDTADCVLEGQFLELSRWNTRAALAAADSGQEPVAFTTQDDLDCCKRGIQGGMHPYVERTRAGRMANIPLYTAPPLPSREAIADVLLRFHRSACYPDPGVGEVDAYAQAILDLLGQRT